MARFFINYYIGLLIFLNNSGGGVIICLNF